MAIDNERNICCIVCINDCHSSYPANFKLTIAMFVTPRKIEFRRISVAMCNSSSILFKWNGTAKARTALIIPSIGNAYWIDFGSGWHCCWICFASNNANASARRITTTVTVTRAAFVFCKVIRVRSIINAHSTLCSVESDRAESFDVLDPRLLLGLRAVCSCISTMLSEKRIFDATS